MNWQPRVSRAVTDDNPTLRGTLSAAGACGEQKKSVLGNSGPGRLYRTQMPVMAERVIRVSMALKNQKDDRQKRDLSPTADST
jgi:hypothetical protein